MPWNLVELFDSENDGLRGFVAAVAYGLANGYLNPPYPSLTDPRGTIAHEVESRLRTGFYH